MPEQIKVTRTMNNSLIVGKTTSRDGIVTVIDPFAMIPMKEGIRLIPLDIDLIGVRMESIEITPDKVFYTSNVSEVIENEYYKLLENPEEVSVENAESAGDTETQE